MILYVQHHGKYVLVRAKHHQRWLTSPHSESAFGEIATEPMEHSLHLCYKFAMRKTIERWLLFKYVGLEFTPLSKPFNTKEQAEKARMKYPGTSTQNHWARSDSSQIVAMPKYPAMAISLEDTLLTVWLQSLVENKKTIALENANFPVRSTAKRKLKQVDFQFDGKDLRGLEQNPDTKSRWAAMARNGKKVMQFLEGGRYAAVVADGKVHLYAPRS